jgi:hypothetical protein
MGHENVIGKGAAMEAHAGTIGVRTRPQRSSRTGWLARLMLRARQQRLEHARRAHALRESAGPLGSVQGSEHSHLLRRPRGF